MIGPGQRRIVQVLNNLIASAARYSEASSVIRLTAVREDIHVAISVADEGTGVAADLLPHLFGKFSGIDTVNGKRRASDTGLGLAICKGIVEAHGGRVGAESDGPGLGTTLTFTVPAAEKIPGGSVPETVSKTEHSRDPHRPGDKILVVDDDPQTLKYVRDTPTKEGYTITVTADPEEVAPLIKSFKPERVLLDLMLPGTDGFVLMEDIVEVYSAPVIFLSGYGNGEIVARASDIVWASLKRSGKRRLNRKQRLRSTSRPDPALAPTHRAPTRGAPTPGLSMTAVPLGNAANSSNSTVENRSGISLPC